MTRKRRAERLDGIDAENIRMMLESEAWQLTQQRIERTLELKVGELQQPLDAVETAQVRGYIQGLKLALSVPAILTAEAKQTVANQKPTSREAVDHAADALEMHLIQQGWASWKRQHPAATKKKRSAFLIGFQMGLLAAELKSASKCPN